MRPERPSGASGYPQAQENSTQHRRTYADRTRGESVRTDALTGCAYVGTGCACACACGYAYVDARSGSGRRASEPDALTSRA